MSGFLKNVVADARSCIGHPSEGGSASAALSAVLPGARQELTGSFDGLAMPESHVFTPTSHEQMENRSVRQHSPELRQEMFGPEAASSIIEPDPDTGTHLVRPGKAEFTEVVVERPVQARTIHEPEDVRHLNTGGIEETIVPAAAGNSSSPADLEMETMETAMPPRTVDDRKPELDAVKSLAEAVHISDESKPVVANPYAEIEMVSADTEHPYPHTQTPRMPDYESLDSVYPEEINQDQGDVHIDEERPTIQLVKSRLHDVEFPDVSAPLEIAQPRSVNKFDNTTGHDVQRVIEKMERYTEVQKIEPVKSEMQIGTASIEPRFDEKTSPQPLAPILHHPPGGSPDVRIGQVDVFIEAPKRQQPERRQTRQDSNGFSSRHYLRRI